MYIKRRLGPKQNEPCTKSISRFIFSQFNISVTPVRRENKTKAEEKQTKTSNKISTQKGTNLSVRYLES